MKCRQKRNDNILQRIADLHHVSVEEVRKEIEQAVALARSNPDPQVQEIWKKLLKEYPEPTAEQVIYYFANQIKKEEKFGV